MKFLKYFTFHFNNHTFFNEDTCVCGYALVCKPFKMIFWKFDSRELFPPFLDTSP